MSKDFALILLVTFLCVMGWTAFESYHKSSGTYSKIEYKTAAQPIDIEFNKEQLKILNSKRPVK